MSEEVKHPEAPGFEAAADKVNPPDTVPYDVADDELKERFGEIALQGRKEGTLPSEVVDSDRKTVESMLRKDTQDRRVAILDISGVPDVRAQELETIFTYHTPQPDQPETYQKIRDTAKAFAKLLVKEVPESRELEEAIKAVETAVFWANAGAARRR